MDPTTKCQILVYRISEEGVAREFEFLGTYRNRSCIFLVTFPTWFHAFVNEAKGKDMAIFTTTVRNRVTHRFILGFGDENARPRVYQLSGKADVERVKPYRQPKRIQQRRMAVDEERPPREEEDKVDHQSPTPPS